MEETSTPNPGPSPNQKRSKTVLAVILVVVVVAVAGVAALIILNPSGQNGNDAQSVKSDDPDSTKPGSEDQEATGAIIVFTDDGFSPKNLTVKKGTVVTVLNNSSKSLQFSSDDHPTHREDPEINMDTLAPGKSGSFTVKTVGTHGFHDHIDDSKTGTLVVTE